MMPTSVVTWRSTESLNRLLDETAKAGLNFGDYGDPKIGQGFLCSTIVYWQKVNVEVGYHYTVTVRWQRPSGKWVTFGNGMNCSAEELAHVFRMAYGQAPVEPDDCDRVIAAVEEHGLVGAFGGAA